MRAPYRRPSMSREEMAKLSASEKEKTKLRERQRRAITTKIFAGLRKYGGYNLPPRADINDVLRALANEAGWIVESDGTTYRSPNSGPPNNRHSYRSSLSLPSNSTINMFTNSMPSMLPNGMMMRDPGGNSYSASSSQLMSMDAVSMGMMPPGGPMAMHFNPSLSAAPPGMNMQGRMMQGSSSGGLSASSHSESSHQNGMRENSGFMMIPGSEDHHVNNAMVLSNPQHSSHVGAAEMNGGYMFQMTQSLHPPAPPMNPPPQTRAIKSSTKKLRGGKAVAASPPNSAATATASTENGS